MGQFLGENEIDSASKKVREGLERILRPWSAGGVEGEDRGAATGPEGWKQPGRLALPAAIINRLTIPRRDENGARKTSSTERSMSRTGRFGPPRIPAGGGVGCPWGMNTLSWVRESRSAGLRHYPVTKPIAKADPSRGYSTNTTPTKSGWNCPEKDGFRAAA